MKRRDFLKISAISGAVVAGAAAAGWGLRQRQVVKVQETRVLMGTIINMTVLAPSRAEGKRAIDSTFAEMGRLVVIFDHRQVGGALGRLNHDGKLAGAPPELVAVVRRALAYGELSGGAFDVTVHPVVKTLASGGQVTNELSLVDFRQVRAQADAIEFGRAAMAITLDGIAKGAVVDGAVAVLGELGYQQVLVEAGGDLRAGGANHSWRVAIDHPRSELMAGYVAAFDLTEAAVATSGDYMNTFMPDRTLHHIIDPRVGVSPAELASTTVIAPTATDADALSTTLMVLGAKQGLELANKLTGVEALLVTKDLSIRRTAGFPSSEVR